MIILVKMLFMLQVVSFSRRLLMCERCKKLTFARGPVLIGENFKKVF